MAETDVFILRIHTRTGHFGETAAAERHGVAKILGDAAHQIGSGAPYSPLKDTGGHVIAEFEWGEAMINGPGEGFDGTHRQLPPVNMGGRLP